MPLRLELCSYCFLSTRWPAGSSASFQSIHNRAKRSDGVIDARLQELHYGIVPKSVRRDPLHAIQPQESPRLSSSVVRTHIKGAV